MNLIRHQAKTLKPLNAVNPVNANKGNSLITNYGEMAR